MKYSFRLLERLAHRASDSARLPKVAIVIGLISALTACATSAGRGQSPDAAAEEVRSAELSFAKTMADRDFNAFFKHLSHDAVFFDGENIQRGASQVAAAWKPLFTDSKAPFSWAPDRIEVLGSGDLALSTGPVTINAQIVGRFNSIWRLEAPHTWRIVFDKGEAVCSTGCK